MLYIVHVQIQRDVAPQWAVWMEQQHIPDVLKTDCFEWALMSRDEAADTPSHEGYRFSYLAKTPEALAHYQQEFAQALQRDHTERYGAYAIARRELLTSLAYWPCSS